MTPDVNTLIWLFPIAFMLHDFEELMFFEPWLKRNAGAIMERLKSKIPVLLERRLYAIAGKTTTQFAFPICLIFILISLSSFLAATAGTYAFFLIASSLFLVHGFAHVGQAILLRRYVPSLITSLLIVIPYGVALFWRLTAAGLIAIPEVLAYFVAAVILGGPVVIAMHAAGEYAYKRATDLLVG